MENTYQLGIKKTAIKRALLLASSLIMIEHGKYMKIF